MQEMVLSNFMALLASEIQKNVGNRNV